MRGADTGSFEDLQRLCEDGFCSPSNVLKDFRHEPRQADEIITAVRRRAKDDRIFLQRIKGRRENIGRERRAIAADDDGRGRSVAKTIVERADQALPEVARTLRAAEPAVAKPMAHCVFIVTGKTNFQLRVLRLAKSVSGSERAKNQPTMLSASNRMVPTREMYTS